MLNTIWGRKDRSLGHVLRNEVLLRDIIEGRMNGKSYRERKKHIITVIDLVSSSK